MTSYTLTVTNAGNLASVPPDTVQDTLPGGFVFVSGGGNGWTCTASGQNVTCTSGTPIPPGGSSTFTITVSVPCGSQPTQNCAKVATTLEFDLSDNMACDPTNVTSPVPGCTPPPPNMTAWWPFDEAAGPTAADIAGAVNNNGTHQQGHRCGRKGRFRNEHFQISGEDNAMAAAESAVFWNGFWEWTVRCLAV